METTLFIPISNYLAVAEYSCGDYGEDDYQSDTCTTATTGQSSTEASSLAETGVSIILPLALGIALIGAAIVILVQRYRKS